MRVPLRHYFGPSAKSYGQAQILKHSLKQKEDLADVPP